MIGIACYDDDKQITRAQGGQKKDIGEFREPENLNLRSWLRTLRDLRKNSEGRSDLIELIGDYLVCVPGTPTVERWLGEVAMQEAKHRARKIDIERLEATVRINKQDLAGRRPVGSTFDPKQLLIKQVPSRTHYGGTVVWPATPFAVDSQAIHVEFYGRKQLPARSLIPQPPEQLVKLRLLAERPCLARQQPARKTNTLVMTLADHAAGVKRSISALEIGAVRGPFGDIPRQSHDGETGTLKEMVESVCQLDHDRMLGDKLSSKRLRTPEKAAALAAEPPEIARQMEVLAKKRKAAVQQCAGNLAEYVGPRGERWKKEDNKKHRHVPAPSKLSSTIEIKVFMGPGCMASNKLSDHGLVVKSKLRHCDVVVVDDIGARWQDVAAVEARIYGLRLADAAWVISRQQGGSCVVFRRMLDKRHSIFFSEAFDSEQPVLARALVLASERALRWADKCRSEPMFSARVGKRPPKPANGSTTYMLYSNTEYGVWTTQHPIRMIFESEKELLIMSLRLQS